MGNRGRCVEEAIGGDRPALSELGMTAKSFALTSCLQATSKQVKASYALGCQLNAKREQFHFTFTDCSNEQFVNQIDCSRTTF